jgi:lipid-binding SYLF domain-containing protein
MRFPKSWLQVFALILAASVTHSSIAAERQDARLLTSTKVLQELMQMPEQNIPVWLLERAYAIAIVPDVIKVGLGIGARRGKGVLLIRKDNGSWSNPIFVNLTGGSFGFQVGVQSTDVVLVFATKQGVEGIVGGKVTLGADASVAAGPVGRQSSAATDIGLNAQVYSYSRASGLFAGVALDGSALTIDHRSDELFYDKVGILPSEIMRPDAPAAPAPADKLLAAVGTAVHGPGASQVASQASPGATSASSSSSNTATPPKPIEAGATTYPMEDPQAGSEPPQ